eukprot:TRINITY_DN4360_c0_g1_i1.p3 TRINITY_DN4360_c0_g1~~TRINITY_DN4360_c0_g1_i1.p3  ORF type:complete len:81 (+),score=23.21 TRINITY_DN4360_c0_g1_i1:336-578(+)
MCRTWGDLYSKILETSYDIRETLEEYDEAEFDTDNTLEPYEALGLDAPAEVRLASNFIEARALFIPALNNFSQALKTFIP